METIKSGALFVDFNIFMALKAVLKKERIFTWTKKK